VLEGIDLLDGRLFFTGDFKLGQSRLGTANQQNQYCAAK
jgi:hypothetical protein